MAATAAMALGACEQAPHPKRASIVVTDARVWTGDPEMPWAEAVAVDGNTIMAVGSAADIASLTGDETRVISIAGSMLVPGFIDTHVHFLDGGKALSSVQLRDAATPAEFARRIGEFAGGIDPGEWILGGTWDHELWGGELPRRDWIDDVTPENPVWVQRLDGHMALANSLALKAAGVDADTPDVEGGVIERYEDGRPTGLLKDNAMSPVNAAVAPFTDEQLDRLIKASMDHVVANGVTTVHDVANLVDWTNFEIYQRLHERGELIMRIYSIVPIQTWERLHDFIAEHGTGDDWLRIGGLKGMMDGSLGSHTAAFFDPFSDAPNDSGFLVVDIDDMRKWAMGADAAGLHVNIHAIGDRAIRDLLDIYHDVAEANGPRDRRFRIEHAQHPHPDDIKRIAVQNVIASMQPYHAIDDGRWAERVIGSERIKTTYAFRSLIDAGAHLAFGSDWTVAPATPLDGIYAAVTRSTIDGATPEGWVPEQKITVEEALRAYTYEGAYASFEEDSKGTIRPGMLADLVLLDRDITAIDPNTIPDSNVLMTIIGGEVVYDSERGVVRPK
jgi:predicted amidohydrolase YtcJ